jgi:hypothetical protein
MSTQIFLLMINQDIIFSHGLKMNNLTFLEGEGHKFFRVSAQILRGRAKVIPMLSASCETWLGQPDKVCMPEILEQCMLDCTLQEAVVNCKNISLQNKQKVCFPKHMKQEFLAQVCQASPQL